MHDREGRLADIAIASEEPDMTETQELKFYQEDAVRTKSDLLEMIQEAKVHICKEVPAAMESKMSDACYKRLEGLFDRFYADVETMYLMEPLDNWWGYSISVRRTGISLKLVHLAIMYDMNIKITNERPTKACLCADEDFILHTTKAKLLSLDEFGNLHGVAGDTVRQWIRRGKIREAVKLGSDWRIPELVDLPDRGYSPGHYHWEDELSSVPDLIPDINQYDSLYIQPGKETGKWDISLGQFYELEGPSKSMTLSSKEKEKLELFMISSSEVECPNNYLGEVCHKHPKISDLLADAEDQDCFTGC